MKARKPSKRTSLYSIEFSSQHKVRQAESDGDDSPDCLPAPVSPKPMTPRRVKRRSVMQRGTTSRHSTNSRRHAAHSARSSTRSARSIAQNPVTRIMEQQQQQLKTPPFDGSISPSGGSPPEPLPIYYNSVSSNSLLPGQSNAQPHWQLNGHTNPTYQQSSTQSLNVDQDDLDDLYNNRPASVRSSYSNFHGTRAISYGAPHYYHSHATPQVPQKRAGNTHRQSMRSMVFINNGPPAYTTQGQNSVDSETTI